VRRRLLAAIAAVAALTTPFATAGAATTPLAGRAFVYEVAGYRILMEFLAEDRLRWEYLAAPDGQAGKSATETFDRRDLRPGLVLVSWSEADGTDVFDVFDIERMELHASFVWPDGTRQVGSPIRLAEAPR
jgi:hypothetical protein